MNAEATAPTEALTFIPVAEALKHPACASPRPGKKPHKSKLYRWVQQGRIRGEYRRPYLFVCLEDLDAMREPVKPKGRQVPAAVKTPKQVEAAAEEFTRRTLARFGLG